MEFGLIILSNIQLRLSPGRYLSPCKHMQTDGDDNSNAKSSRTSTLPYGPSASTSNSRTGRILGQQDYGPGSTTSLIHSISFETPFGVVHHKSSSTIEPEKIHRISSQDSFRQDIGLFKKTMMPALDEDGDPTSGDAGNLPADALRKCYSPGGRPSGNDKCNGTRRCKVELAENEAEQDVFDDIDISSTKEPNGGFELGIIENKVPKRTFLKRIEFLFSCTKKQDEECVDSENLITKDGFIDKQ